MCVKVFFQSYCLQHLHICATKIDKKYVIHKYKKNKNIKTCLLENAEIRILLQTPTLISLHFRRQTTGTRMICPSHSTTSKAQPAPKQTHEKNQIQH